jgi:uncharacterized protein YgiM (DUF1202 family)
MKPYLLLFALIASAAPSADKSVPVMVGEVARLNACPSLGVITSANEVSLHSGPGDGYQVITKLEKGDHVHVCSIFRDSQWTGVVLAMDGILDCGVWSPIPAPKPYDGPCISGWIPANAVEIVAG